MIQESRRTGILLTGSETRMRHRTTSRRGFSLTELVVVIAIIAVLMAIAIPVVSKIRRSAQTANTKNFISQLDGAINRYYGDFHGYPGPLTFHEIDNALSGGTPGPTVGPGTPFPEAIDTVGLNYQGSRPGQNSPQGTYPLFKRDFPNKFVFGSETASTISSRGDYTFPVATGNGAISRSPRAFVVA